jgi:hypothetical protein
MATRCNQARRDTEGEAATFKWCNQCLEDKRLEEFHKDGNSKLFGRKAHCKVCYTREIKVKRRLKKENQDTTESVQQAEAEEEKKEEENDVSTLPLASWPRQICSSRVLNRRRGGTTRRRKRGTLALGQIDSAGMI